LKSYIYTKANAILIQQGIGAMGRTLNRKKEEFQQAVDAMERGESYLRVIPSLWVWADSPTLAVESSARAKRLWEAFGYTMQEDRLILPPLLIASVPFGLYNKGNTIQLLQRDFIAPTKSIVQIMPIQADYSGAASPAMLTIGRKGQICAVDLFESRENFNCLITAASGQGKSFLVNYITLNYYMMGDIIRIVDIGGSYKKMTTLAGAKFLDFSSDADLCINPFTNIIDTEDHPAHEGLSIIPRIIQQMCYSATDEIPHDIAETGMTLISNAVDFVWNEYHNDGGIDHIHEYLSAYPHYCPDKEKESSTQARIDLAHELAFNLTAFSSEGKYGRWFNGPANFDISRDEFVVLELEHLMGSPELFKVVILQLINYISEDLYLSDRSRRRLCFFDEAWRYITSSEIMADVIDQGMRRARKYGGSFTIITQSLMDLENKFGATGAVINANSANKFFLASVDFDKAKDAKLISYEEFGMRLLKSVQSNNPKYSEIFMHSGMGAIGPVRLAVNPFNYYMFTSSAKEIAEIEQMVRQGLTYEEAILEMVKKHRPGVDP
jgi:conjugal transfer ATP-binding protein TraC